LVRRLCDAIEIAKKAIECLAADGYEDKTEPGNNLRPEKVISESGLLLLAASTASRYPEVDERLRDVAERLVPHARSDRILLGICTQPALAWEYAQAHVCLKRLGYADRRFDTALRMVERSQARRGHERPPHRALEQARARDGWSDPRPGRRTRRAPPGAVRDSVLCRPMDLLSGSRDDVYAFTHALMYVTDFNIRPWRLPRDRSVILDEAEAVLARCLDDEDYDLAGEVLLGWPLTGQSWGPAAAFGFRVLARVEDQAGFLPSPGTRLERLHALQGGERTRYFLATAYHTAYVMGLLCAAALQPGRAPPTTIRTARAPRGISRLLLTRLDTGGGRPHWREEVRRLAEADRDSLASMLLSIGLCRAVSQRDFGLLHELLRMARDAGLANAPSASQAAELLSRLTSEVVCHREPSKSWSR
jgi:uncharacterized protein DUF6895